MCETKLSENYNSLQFFSWYGFESCLYIKKKRKKKSLCFLNPFPLKAQPKSATETPNIVALVEASQTSMLPDVIPKCNLWYAIEAAAVRSAMRNLSSAIIATVVFAHWIRWRRHWNRSLPSSWNCHLLVTVVLQPQRIVLIVSRMYCTLFFFFFF